MVGDLYIGRGSKQRGLGRSVWSNPHKVAQSSREEAIRRYSETLRNDQSLSSIIWTLSGARLVCHCTPTQRCHADVLISLFRQTFPAAHDRDQENQPAPTASVLSLLAKLRNEPEEDSGSSADEGVPPKGAGWRGKGQPMMIGSGYVTRELCDGQSLASPGRWPIHDRAYPKNDKWKRASKVIMDFARVHGTAELLMKLALGQVDKCPFDVDSVSELKRQVVETLQRDGIHMSRTSKDRVDVPIDFRFLSALLTAAQDPEVGLGDFACGVRVGPGVRLPRLPALYPAKRKWRLPEQSNPLDHLEGDAGGESAWRRNYTSLQELSDKVVDVLEDQARRGQVLKLSEPEARARFPNLVVASLGANRKDKPNGTVTARVLFDGTHGISVNKRTRIRDQERAPIAADLKRSMREKAREGLTTFALTADVSEAHRQVPIDERDWHLLGCQVAEGQEVYVNTVGTFGVASASYHWSRVASAIGRLSQYLAGDTAQTWHMLVADDFLLEAGGPEYRSALMAFFVLCAVSGAPLSWNKTAGGDTVSWVGFELLLRSHKLGISQRRAEWFTRWTREVAQAGHVNISTFEEGLGRVMYVAGALEYERPFLAPLYKFMSLHPRGSVRKVPAYVSFFLAHLSRQIEENRHYSCATEQRSSAVSPRVDAQASESRTGLGGWLPVLDENGTPDPWRSPWFSIEVTEEEWPWVYEKGGRPALIISTLEALAVLISLRLFFGGTASQHRSKIMVAPTWTDNRGNGSALNKLMTTKFPASAVLMELATYTKKMGMKVLVEWTPRAGNREADALANGDSSLFDPRRRVQLESDVQWEVLDQALRRGREAESETATARAEMRLPDRARKRMKKRKPTEKLRVTDPW